MRRYVGAHAEEIQAYARRTGADEAAQSIGGMLSALGIASKLQPGAGSKRDASMTELLADRAAEIRAEKAAKRPADDSQLTML